MIKKVWFLVLLLSFLGCKAELPTSPDIPEVGFPAILYFNATPVSVGGCSTLSWNAHVVGLTLHRTLQVFLFCEDGAHAYEPGVVPVESVGTREVCPRATTVYTLVAKIGDNSVSEFVVVSVEF